jgi:hypothetical protein
MFQIKAGFEISCHPKSGLNLEHDCVGFLPVAVSFTSRLKQNVRLSFTRARVCSGRDRTVLLSLGYLARNLGEISSVPAGNGFRVRVKMKGVDISDLGVKSKNDVRNLENVVHAFNRYEVVKNKRLMPAERCLTIEPLNMSDFIDMRPTERHNPDSKYAYGRKLERIHQANREINTWNECSIDKSNTACKVIPNFEEFKAQIVEFYKLEKCLFEGTQGCVPGPDMIIEAEIKSDTAGKIVRQSNNARRTESEKHALIEKLDA